MFRAKTASSAAKTPSPCSANCPDLHGFFVEPTEPWAAIDSLDPYRCILRFRALVAAPGEAVETLFHYVVEQVRMAPVSPHSLVSVTGDGNGGAGCGISSTTRAV